jgi:hypothetical protein
VAVTDADRLAAVAPKRRTRAKWFGQSSGDSGCCRHCSVGESFVLPAR